MFGLIFICAFVNLANAKLVELELYKPASIHVDPKLEVGQRSPELKFKFEHEYHETHYLANVSFGTPAQHFQLAVHTGGTSLWVFDQSVNAETGYKANASSTSAHLKAPEFFDSNDDTIFKGETYTDVFEIRDIKFANQSFGSIVHVEEDTEQFLADGILGLGWVFDKKDRNKDEMPILNILDQFDKPLYSLWLQRSHKPTEPSQGFLTLGGLDTKRCQSDVHFVQATKSAYWSSTFQLDGVSVGDYKSQPDQRFTGILDSGSPFIHAESHAHKEFFSKVNAQFDEKLKMYTLECSKLSTLPSWKFTIGGKEMEVRPEDYLLEIDTVDSKCGLAVQHYSSEDFGWFLGQPFLRSVCTVYDVGANRFGFAQPL